MWPKTDDAKRCHLVKPGLGKIDGTYAKQYIKPNAQPKLCQAHVPFVEEPLKTQSTGGRRYLRASELLRVGNSGGTDHPEGPIHEAIWSLQSHSKPSHRDWYLTIDTDQGHAAWHCWLEGPPFLARLSTRVSTSTIFLQSDTVATIDFVVCLMWPLLEGSVYVFLRNIYKPSKIYFVEVLALKRSRIKKQQQITTKKKH